MPLGLRVLGLGIQRLRVWGFRALGPIYRAYRAESIKGLGLFVHGPELQRFQGSETPDSLGVRF